MGAQINCQNAILTNSEGQATEESPDRRDNGFYLTWSEPAQLGICHKFAEQKNGKQSEEKYDFLCKIYFSVCLWFLAPEQRHRHHHLGHHLFMTIFASRSCSLEMKRKRSHNYNYTTLLLCRVF